MKWILGIGVALLAAILTVSFVYLRREWDRTTFFENTTINGYNVSGKSPEEVLALLKGEFTKANVHLTEGGREEAVWPRSDIRLMRMR